MYNFIFILKEWNAHNRSVLKGGGFVFDFQFTKVLVRRWKAFVANG